MSIFGTTGICESFMPIFVLFAKDSVEWPETGKQGGDLPLQRGQKYRNNGKSAAPKRRGGQKAAVGLQRGQETAKSLAAKAAGEKARLLRSAHKETLPQNLAKTGCWLRCRRLASKKGAGVPARCLRPAFAILLLGAPLPRAGRHFLCLTGLCISAALRYTYFNHNTQPPGTVRGCAGEGSRNKTEPGLPRREGSHHAVYH